MIPLFLWQKLPPEPEYHHEVIRDVHTNYFLPFYTTKQSIPGFIVEDVYPLVSMEFRILNIFLMPVIIAFPVLIAWTLRNRWARLGLVIQSFLVLGLLTEPFKYMHYFAPITALNYYFVQRAFRLARWRNKKLGDFIIRLTLFISIAALLVSVYQNGKNDKFSNWQYQRRQLLKQLEQKEGQHLVIVSYGSQHSFHDEWVYNGADIDGAKVLFARAMTTKGDCQLAGFFKLHEIWFLEVNANDSMPQLRPYPLNMCK